MIIAEAVSSPIVTNIGATPSKFKIKASARAFQILSGFYSEPILAIPRELGANAWDSHVKAKNTGQPFEVHAPNTLEPWFSIRDFGVGLSPEQIDSIYTTYFESTKTDDNDSDGCMGLGSKTPFNYTQNFTVVSWWGGKRNVYSCFIDDKGAPNILPMNSEDSAEPNGIQVKFSVKHDDITSFVEKITRAYESFRHRPKITGATITYTEPDYVMSGNRWSLRKNAGYNRSHECRALMGNYSYPINTNAFSSSIRKLAPTDYDDIRRVLDSGSFDFNFNIGDLDVAPNKEQLQYDGENTAKNIIEIARSALAEMRKKVASEIKVPTTLWEAMYLHNKYNSYNSPFHGTIGHLLGNISIQFNGKVVAGSIDINTIHFENKLIPVKVDRYASYIADLKVREEVEKFTSTYHLYNLNRKTRYGVTEMLKTNSTREIHGMTEENQKIIIFYTNESTLKRARVREYLKTNSTPHTTATYLVVDMSPGFSTLKIHAKHLGLPDSYLVNIEALPKPARVVKPKPTVDTSGMVNFSEVKECTRKGYYHTIYFSKTDKKFEPTGTYYYTDAISFAYRYKDADVSKEALSEAVIYANENKLMGDGLGGLYAINKKDKHFMATGTWINIFDLVHKHVKKNVEHIQHHLYLRDKAGPQFYRFDPITQWIKNALTDVFMRKIENKDTIEFFENLLSLYAEIKENKAGHYTEISKLYKIQSKKNDKKSITVEEVVERFDIRYMNIIKHITENNRYNYSCIDDVIKFINFVDKNV